MTKGRRSGDFNVNFEHISHLSSVYIVLVFTNNTGWVVLSNFSMNDFEHDFAWWITPIVNITVRDV